VAIHNTYQATIRQVPGRKAVSVEFRHPLRPDPSNHGKPGRKVRKGLGMDRPAAELLVAELNQLLSDPALHSPAAKARAASIFDSRVVEIFYDGIEPRIENYRELRNEHLPFPPREDGYPRILLLGLPGAGKTTLVRQLIGTDPKKERFPSTSINRTTTCETEVIAGPANFSAVATFMSEEEVDFELRQSISSAVLRAVDPEATDERIAKALLERSDMRFRLKYTLGDWASMPTDDDDPFARSESSADDNSDEAPEPDETKELTSKLTHYVSSVRAIAAGCLHSVDTAQGLLSTMPSDQQSLILDRIQDEAEQSESYSLLVSELIDDIRQRFDEISFGKLVKTTTGWPKLWHTNAPRAMRGKFLEEVRHFSAIERARWGRLLTPLVNGLRVAGPFVPTWSKGLDCRFVLIDTEGLGHKANTVPDVPDYIVSRFPESDAILLVHKGDTPFSFEGGKALEAIGGAGQTSKTMMVFTRMDGVTGPNIKGWQAKKDYSFNGVRNVIEHQIARSLTPEVARFMLAHLEKNAFYLGELQIGEVVGGKAELSRLLGKLTSIVPAPPPAAAFPDYGSYDLLVFALQKGVEGFRLPWRAYLSLQRHSDHRPLPWQSIKAVSRRYSEGFDDGYDIRPASNLLNSMTLAIARFVENPTGWQGTPDQDDKRIILDHIKSAVSKRLSRFCALQLREKARSDWQVAYGFRGNGSTFDRRMKIESLFERWVPDPANDGEDMRYIHEFIHDVRATVIASIDEARDELSRRLAI
jgi:hypothetical protein